MSSDDVVLDIEDFSLTPFADAEEESNEAERGRSERKRKRLQLLQQRDDASEGSGATEGPELGDKDRDKGPTTVAATTAGKLPECKQPAATATATASAPPTAPTTKREEPQKLRYEQGLVASEARDKMQLDGGAEKSEADKADKADADADADADAADSDSDSSSSDDDVGRQAVDDMLRSYSSGVPPSNSFAYGGAKDGDFDMFASSPDDDDEHMTTKPTTTDETDGGGQARPAGGGRAAADPDASSSSMIAAPPPDLTLSDNRDYAEGYYRTRVGDVLSGRYAVRAYVGRGVFSSVLRCADEAGVFGNVVAVKVVRRNETMAKAAAKEIKILQALNRHDRHCRKCVIRLLDCGEHRGHVTLVFESMHMNLRECLNKFGRDVGINLVAVRSYAAQLLVALSHLKKFKVVHADIKPDNVLVSSSYAALKLCDFGSAFFTTDSDSNEPTPYLISRFYRPPEVMLGLDYGHAADMWSVGATLVELFTGRVAFPGKTNNEMLRRFATAKGPFPNKVLRRHVASFERLGLERHYDEELRFVERGVDPVTNRPSRKVAPTVTKAERPVSSLLQAHHSKTTGGGGKGAQANKDRAEILKFGDLVEKILTLDADKRLGVDEARIHGFIKQDKGEQQQQQQQHGAEHQHHKPENLTAEKKI